MAAGTLFAVSFRHYFQPPDVIPKRDIESSRLISAAITKITQNPPPRFGGAAEVGLGPQPTPFGRRRPQSACKNLCFTIQYSMGEVNQARQWSRMAWAMAALFASMPAASKLFLGVWGFDGAAEIACLFLILGTTFTSWAGAGAGLFPTRRACWIKPSGSQYRARWMRPLPC